MRSMTLQQAAALLLTCSLCLVPELATAGPIVFSTDFEAGVPAEISGTSFRTSSEGYGTGQFLRNTNTLASVGGSRATLTLTGLPTHTSINLDFLLATINSWDGVDGGASPDYLNVSIDGVTIFSEAFDNLVKASQTYNPPDGVQLTPRNGVVAAFAPDPFANLGFLGPGHLPQWGEALYSMGRDTQFDEIAHTGATLAIAWFASGAGYQGGVNESWGLDNIVVTLNDGSPGESEGDPILPTDPPLPDGGFVFTQAPSGYWIDPPLATGFDFATTDGSKITAILDLPTGFASPFNVLTGGNLVGQFGPGQIVSFGTGVSSFSITGIDPGVELNNPNVFPIRLEFDRPTASLTMTPIEIISTVPEPASLTVWGLGLVGFAGMALRKRDFR